MPINTVIAMKKGLWLLPILCAFLFGQANIGGLNTEDSLLPTSIVTIQESQDTLLIKIPSSSINKLDKNSFVIIGTDWKPSSMWEGLLNPPSTYAKKIMLNGR